MKELFLLALIIFGCLLQMNGQIDDNRNFVQSNYSYAFFGSGDLVGTSFGVDYHRTLWKGLGVGIGVSKSSAKGKWHEVRDESYGTEPVNFSLKGKGIHAEKIAKYDSYILGANYRITSGTKQSILISAGLNFKQFDYNYLSTVLYGAASVSVDGVTTKDITIVENTFVSDTEWGFYLGLDYQYIVYKNMYIGVRLSVEASENILSKAGLSLGFNF